MSSNRDNTLRTARNLGALSGSRTLQDSLSNSDRLDYVKFQLGSRSRLTFALNGLQRTANVQLLNDAGAVLAQFNQLPARRGRAIAKLLNAGLYYLRIGQTHGNTRYTLTLNTPVLQEPGNIPVRSRNLGVFAGRLTFRDTVGNPDTADYYHFQVNSLTNFSVILSGTNGYVNLALYRDLNNNRAIDTNENVTGMFGSYKSFSEWLPTGSYYLKASTYLNGANRYTITLNSVPYPNFTHKPDPGNQSYSAQDLGTLSPTSMVQDYVGHLDEADYFRFRVNEVMNLNVVTNGLEGQTITTLYRDLNNNAVIDSGEQVTSQIGNSTSFTKLLTPGIYYVSVEDFLWDSTRYSLFLRGTSYSGYATTSDPGNQAYLAQNLGNLSNSTVLRGYVGEFDTVDYYRFQLDSVSELSTIFTGWEGNVYTKLYKDINNNGIIDTGEWVTGKSGTTGSFSEWLTPGTYYLGVERYVYDSSRYDVTLNLTSYPSYTSNPDPGNQSYAARNIGLLSQPTTFQDYVGKLDEVDYYQFQLTENRDFSAILTGLEGDATIALYQDLNTNGVLDDGEWLTSWYGNSVSLERSLTPGTYYIGVTGSIYDSTRYQLALNTVSGI